MKTFLNCSVELAARLVRPQAERYNQIAFRLKKLADACGAIHFISVHLAHLRLRDFRNYARLDVDFAPGFHLLLGGNAQGKTNILEAIYLMATLRSFRGVGGAQRDVFVGRSQVRRAHGVASQAWLERLSARCCSLTLLVGFEARKRATCTLVGLARACP